MRIARESAETVFRLQHQQTISSSKPGGTFNVNKYSSMFMRGQSTDKRYPFHAENAWMI
jgi:hypothetical protein